MAIDWDTLKITDKRRRRSVTGIIEATVGVRHGRCLICGDALTPSDATAVDHVFPYSLMRRFAGVGAWHGPGLDALWNLAPRRARHLQWSQKRPELAGLAARNEAIMNSPHPLRRTLQFSLKSVLPRQNAASCAQFLQAVQTTI